MHPSVRLRIYLSFGTIIVSFSAVAEAFARDCRLSRPVMTKDERFVSGSTSTTTSLFVSRRSYLQNFLWSLPPTTIVTQQVVGTTAVHAIEASSSSPSATTVIGSSDDDPTKQSSSKFRYAFRFDPPPSSQRTGKPLQTHYEEIQFAIPDISSYQYGITVDPVRINSLTEFGTPQEVAAKVVLAELNRDGVYNVKLMNDPESITVAGTTTTEGSDPAEYVVLNYLSQGKRGDKRFVVKFSIKDHMLYALTAQCREGDYSRLQNEINQAVASFQVL